MNPISDTFSNSGCAETAKHTTTSAEKLLLNVSEKRLTREASDLISDTFSNRGCAEIAKQTATSAEKVLLNVSEKRLTRETFEPNFGHLQ